MKYFRRTILHMYKLVCKYIFPILLKKAKQTVAYSVYCLLSLFHILAADGVAPFIGGRHVAVFGTLHPDNPLRALEVVPEDRYA